MKISNVKMLPISNANSNLGLATLALATLATLATFAASALPLPWRADWPDAKPVETLVHRGTDIELQPTWRINKEPADTNGWTFTTYCQTNAVGPWFGPMPGAFFSHTNDVGAAFYNVMVRAQTPGGAVNYTAFARLRMLDSPGYTPGALPLPAKSIDFADVATYNAPWLLPDATNDFARADDIAPTITNTVTKQFVESLGIDAGTTNYADLANKPAVNGVTLAGDKTSAELGLADAEEVSELAGEVIAKYTKPQGGIPASDMAQEVQTSLNKANTALQTAPVTSVNNKTGAVALDASDVGALPNNGGSIGNGIIRAGLPSDEDEYAEFASDGITQYNYSGGRWVSTNYGPFWVNIDGKIIAFQRKSGTLAFLSDIPSVTPLSGRTFDFATTQGVMDALKATIEALGGTVTNAPTTPVQNNQIQGE